MSTIKGNVMMKKMTTRFIASAFEFLILTLCFLLVFPPQFAFAGAPVPDGSTGTTVGHAGNGVPVVNIATPNGSGMSHNAYTSYNVDTHGLILNNGDLGQKFHKSDLAGFIAANPNLAAGKHASIILNEVTGGGRTALNGFTEVLGAKADVIIANPFGITSSGGGFLNTDRVSLVTGAPDLAGGTLNGFDVKGGDILITGTGLDASAQQILDLVSRKIVVEGQVNAQHLKAYAGTNRWSQLGLHGTIASDGTPAPTYAIDSSALGGMYAGRINLVATEAGTGVRMQGEAASKATDFVISASGKIELSSNISAERMMNIQTSSASADAIKASGVNLTAGQLYLTANSGGAITVANSNLFASKDFGLTSSSASASAIAITDSSLSSAGNLFLAATNGGATLVGGGFKADSALNYNLGTLSDTSSATAGVTNANKRFGATTNLTGAGAWVLDNVYYGATTSFDLSAQSMVLGETGSTVISSDGTLGLASTLAALDLRNTELLSVGDMNLTANGALLTGSAAKAKSSAGNMNLTAGVNVYNQGTLDTTSGNIVIRAGSGTNNAAENPTFLNAGAGSIWAGGELRISNKAGLDWQNIKLANTSQLGGSTVDIRGYELEMTDTAVLTSTGDMAVSLVASGIGSIASGAKILGVTGRAGTLTFVNRDGSGVGHFTNNGVIYSGQDLVGTNFAATGMGGVVSASRNLSMRGAGQMYGEYIAGNDLSLMTDGSMILMPNSNGSPNAVLSAGHNISLTGQQIFNWSTINAGNDVIIDTSHMFKNTLGDGSIPGIAELYYNGFGVVNSGSGYTPKILAGHAVGITVGSFGGQNVGTISAPAVHLFSNGDFYNAGTISGASVNIGGSFDNVATGVSASGTPSSSTNVTPVQTPGGITFGGISITIPSLDNPYGLFVSSQDPTAAYLIESNSLYVDISNFYGSDNLARLLNLDPDSIIKRLGDAAYEAMLVREQLLAKTGSSIVVAGVQSEAAQMEAFIGSAATQAESLGLEYGIPLTDEQQANLKGDMVWMVEKTVDGQKVLVPEVYLGAETLDFFSGDGGIVAGDTVNANVATMTNSGTIRGNNVNIVSAGDMRNEGGVIKGGDVSVSSTGGSVLNNTKVTENLFIGPDGLPKLQTTVGKSGVIQGTNSVSLSAAENVENKGGTIQGGQVNLKAGKDVVNSAVVATSSDGRSLRQNIAAQGNISATGDLNIEAGRDVNNLGAQMSAGGDASIKAERDVNFDTVELTNTDIATSSSKGFLKESSSSTVATAKFQHKGGLTTGGNLNIEAKRDVNLISTDLTAGKSANVDAGGDVNLLTRSNSVEIESKSHTKGLGVGGGLFGQSDTTTNALTSKAQVSSISSGGDTNLSAEKTATLVGAKLNSGKDVNISATDVSIVEARDVNRITTQTETTSFLSISKGEGDTSSSSAGASSGAGSGQANAKADAQASASHDAGGLDFKKTIKKNTFDETTTAVGSQINAKGGLTITSKKDTLIRGADVKADGDVTLTGENVNIMAAQDTKVSLSETKVDKVGLYADTTNKASAGADAGASASAKKTKVNASASATANADASTKTNIDFVRNKTTKTATLDITNKGTTLSSGGNLKINSAKTLTVQGSDISGEKSVDVKAKDMKFLAAEDVHTSVTTVEKSSTGLYIDGDASANAKANANAKAGLGLGAKANAGGSASASAKAELSIGMRNKNTSTTDAESTTTARVSTITSGSGSITRTAENDITDVGTTVDAAGDYTQSSKTYTSKAAENKSFKVSESSDSTVKVGVYAKAEAGANAQAGASASVGRKGKTAQADASAKVSANVGAGLKASYDKNDASSSSSSSDAVVSTIKSGGKMKITTTGATSLEGTKLSGAKGVEIEAGSLDFKAAKSTTSSSSSSSNVNAAVSVGVTRGTGKGVEASASGGTSKTDESSSSSTAMVGGIESSSGNISITTKDDTRLEGTNLSAAGDTSIDAGGEIKLDAARDTKQSSKSSSDISAGLDVGESASIAKSSAGISLNAEGGTSKSSSSSSTATAGSIKTGGKLNLNAGKSVTLEGTKMDAGGDATISGKEGVNFKAARSTSESKSVGARLGGQVGKAQTTDATETTTGKSVSGKAEANYSKSKESIAEAGSLKSGGNLVIKSGKDVNLEGTGLAAKNKASINAGGAVNFRAAKSTSESTNIGVSVSGSSSKTTKTPKAAPKNTVATPKKADPATPSTPIPSAKAKNPGTGGTQGSDGSAKSDKALSDWQKKHGNVMQELKNKQNPATSTPKTTSVQPTPKTVSTLPASSITSKKANTLTPTPPIAPRRTSVSVSKGTPLPEGPPSTDNGVPTTEKKTPTKVSGKLEVNKTTKQQAGSIKAGAGGIEINAGGGDANLEGTNMDTIDDVSINAKKNVKITAIKKTESSLGSTVEKNQGATINSGSQVNVSSGGKVLLVNTDIEAANGETIKATGGIERKME